LRQKTYLKVCLAQETEWHTFGSWINKPGRTRWLGQGWQVGSEIYLANLLVHWAIGEDEPWCLATNVPDRKLTLQAYGRSGWKKCLEI